jgi:hypothetical protein
MGIEEGEKVEAKVTYNIFNKKTQKISQISRNRCPFRYKKPP